MSYGDDYEDPRARGIPAQTRTRLPEGEEPSASRRPPASPGRSMVTIVGVVVLLIAAIIFANQTGTDEGGGSSDEPSQRANPTAPSGAAPVEGASGGVPSGFSRDEQGAQSAAANYAVALGGVGMFDAEQRESIVRAVYAPDEVDQQIADLEEVYTDPAFLERVGLGEDGSVPEGMTFVSRINPVGTNLIDFSGNRATVEVWYSALFGLAGTESTNPVTESWYTNTYELAWTEGDWKVTEFSQEDGPVPVALDQRASSAEEMAEAVERFGGFTYAR